jgi:hypothetical protein
MLNKKTALPEKHVVPLNREVPLNIGMHILLGGKTLYIQSLNTHPKSLSPHMFRTVCEQ